MPISLPPALQAAVDAINAGDEESFVATFSPAGVVNDWGAFSSVRRVSSLGRDRMRSAPERR